jgi:hypothetical protein
MAIEKVIDIQVNSNFDTTEAQLKELTTALKQVDNEATNLDATFEEIYGDLKPLTARMGEAEDRLYELAKAGKQSSQEYKDLLKSVGEYKRVQQQTDLVVDAAAQTMGSKLTGSLNAAAGGFSLAQGSMALFGSESSSVEAAMLKVQSAMAISQGFETINQSTNSIKQLGTTLKNTSVVQKTLTAATAAYTFVNQAATTGLKLFRLALIGTGIGAIVVGLGLLIANFDKVKETIMKVIPGLSSVGKVIGGIVDSITDFVGATSDTTRALDKLKENADKTLSVNKKFMQEHGDQVDEYTKKKIDAKNAYAEAVKEDGANEAELSKRLNRELAAIEYSRGDEKRKLQKAANEKVAADRKSDAEKLKKEREDEAKKLKEEKDKAIISEAEAYRNQLEAVQKVEADARKANADALLTEQQLAIQTENEAYEIKKANAIKFGEETIELETEHWNKINNINLTAHEKQNATDKANSDAKVKLIELEKKARLDAADETAKTLSAMSDLLGKETAAGKAAAIASATINTFSSAQKAYDATVGIPYVGPILAPINAGIAIAAGIKNVKSILAVKVPGGGGGGSAPSGGASAQAGVTAPSFNVVGASGTNQLAQSIGAQQQQPIQAYVVANNVTTAQSLQRNIIESATIGG